MISEKKEEIIAAIGKNHISKISAFAKKRGVLKKDGSEYSNQFFSYVLHGDRDNDEVENAIIECAEYYLDKREARRKRMEKLAKRVNKTA